jgi:hypothetical protein
MVKLAMEGSGRVQIRSILFLGIFLLSWVGASLAEGDEEAIRARFLPYEQRTPRVPGIEPGVTLTSANVQLATEVLPEEVLRLVAAGDFSLPLQETTNLPPRSSYLDTTIQYSQGVVLDSGKLANYHAGMPFPLLDPADPQAGEKLAWNLRYRDLGESFELRMSPREVNASGGVEHTNRGLMRIRFGMHRPNPADDEPQWHEQGVLMKNSFELLAPSDQEGNLNMRIFYDDDNRAAEQWRYSPQNRRSRKDHVNFISPIGGYYEMLQEEQPPFFFQGYIRDYEWSFRGARVMLVPGFLNTTELSYGGKNGWYPQMPWELRSILVLECTPRATHPFGKRVFFLDQQTLTPLLSLTYGADGTFIRLGVFAHATPNVHPGSRGLSLPLMTGGVWINYAKNRATLFTAGDSMIYNLPLPAQRFELIEILRKGK